MITDKVGGSSAKPEVSKQSKEKRLKHKVSGYKSESKWRSIAGCRLLLRTLWTYSKKLTGLLRWISTITYFFCVLSGMCVNRIRGNVWKVLHKHIKVERRSTLPFTHIFPCNVSMILFTRVKFICVRMWKLCDKWNPPLG